MTYCPFSNILASLLGEANGFCGSTISGTSDANYADAEIYPDDDICKIFTQSSLRSDLLSKVCGFSILKPVKTSVSDNISNQFNLLTIQMTVCIYPFKRKKNATFHISEM